LQNLDIGCNCPAVGGFNPGSVGIHDSITTRDDIKEIARGRFAKAVNMERRWQWISPLRNHSFAITQPTVAGRAINVVPFLTAEQELPCERNRDGSDQVSACFSSVKSFVVLQVSAGNSVGRHW